MQLTYSFLRDELALIEIRKHKWIESEKQGREVGFATAAHEWINKYGYTWKQFRIDSEAVNNVFAEKRQYRRFPYHFPVILSAGSRTIASHTNDLSLIGFSCTVPQYLEEDSEAAITINFQPQAASPASSEFRFTARILRATHPQKDKANLCYNIFLPLNEEIRNYLRTNTNFFGRS